MKQMNCFKYVLFITLTIISSTSIALDMTQDRPLVGMSPTPDDFYLPPNNPPSLRKFHCPQGNSSPLDRSGGACFNRWKPNRYDCFPCRRKGPCFTQPNGCAIKCSSEG